MAHLFSWDKKAQQFRWTTGPGKGRFVSREKVASLRDDYIKQSKQDVLGLTEDLLANKINVKDFEAGMAKALKTAHVNSYLLGLGGALRFDNARDKGIVGAKLKAEYRYLRRFSKAILNGELTPNQIRARAKQYFNGLHGTFERARNEGHRRNAYVWEKDVRSASESCKTCIALEERGWVRIGRNPPIGVGRECGGNCRCMKMYDNSLEKPSVSALSQAVASSMRLNYGWIK